LAVVVVTAKFLAIRYSFYLNTFVYYDVRQQLCIAWHIILSTFLNWY